MKDNQSKEIIETKIDSDSPAGVPEGHVIETPAGEPNEKIVHDLDADGNVIGWHKEIVKNG